MVDPARLRSEFSAVFGRPPRVFSAPGRVNLIGEHTDYNDGFVLPMAIERRTHVACAANGSSRVRARSKLFDREGEFDLSQPSRGQNRSWLDYVEGTARALVARGTPVAGADLLIDSDVPPGAGLSASAALELSVGIALTSLGGSRAPDRVQLALAGQAAEHQYVGTLCGIMDQYIAALGRADSALLIDCRSLETVHVPLALTDVSVLICDTRVKHELSSSEYNVRRAECRKACELLSQWLPGVRSLRDVSVSDLEAHQSDLPEVLRQRSRHVVTENARTQSAAAALARGDFHLLGALMSESHTSLRDDYQVSCDELDLAVSAALAEPGVYGARMTGGGFGGCTVSLVEKRSVGRVVEGLKLAFRARGFREPELFVSKACDGARED